MRAFEAAGVTRLHTAYSRVPGEPKVCLVASNRYLEDIWASAK